MVARIAGVGVALLGLALAGCQGAPPTSTEPAPAASTALVDIGDGRRIFLRCEGRGLPTVVLISGQDMSSDAWRVVPNAERSDIEVSDDSVFASLARQTRVCAYDRPSTSWPVRSRSTPVAQPAAADTAVADLRATLAAAQVPGPYVLVGHSYGGMIAVLYAEEDPEEVVGLVLVDPANRYLREVVDGQWWADMQRLRLDALDPNGPELADFDASADAITAAAPVPSVPAIVLTSDARPPEMIDDSHFPAWVEAHRLLAAELDAQHVTRTGSGHTIQVEQPALVLQAVRDVLAAATPS